MRTASILVNGNNNHHEKDKALLKLNDRLLIYYVAKRVSKSVDKVILGAKNEIQAEKILSNVPFFDDLAYTHSNDYSLVSGLFSTLNNSPEGLNLLIRCDMALVEPGVIEYLFDSIKQHDAVLPRYEDGGLEYLLGVYKVKKTREAAKKVLEDNNNDIKDLIDHLNVKYVPVESLREIDNDLTSLKKISGSNNIKEVSNEVII